jgi:hypothetical protein
VREKMAKQAFSKKIEEIDLVAEKRLLATEEWEERIDLENKLDKMSRLEDLRWKQKARKNWVLHGDANTHLFHQFINGRRKNSIAYFDSEGGEIRGREISLLTLFNNINTFLAIMILDAWSWGPFLAAGAYPK